MAWAEKKPSGRYVGKYRGPDGKVRTAEGGPWTHKPEAQRAASAAEAKSRSLGWRDPAAAGKTWSEWDAAWWPSRTVEASTHASDLGRRDKYLMPRWGNVRLIDITRHDVKAWAAELGDGLSPASVQRIVHLLSASLRAAVDAEVLHSNPASVLRLQAPAPSAERFLTREEFDAIAEHLDGWALQLAELLVGTGLRWSEAVGLHCARVDYERRVVEVSDVWSLKARDMKPYPKGRRRRFVPVPEWVNLGKTQPGTCGYEHVQGKCRSGLVITNSNGRIIEQPRFRELWIKACTAAEVGHVRVHDLRHTYASWLLQSGIPLAEVGKLLGHTSPLTTQRYAHLADTPSAAVLAALSRGAPPPSEPDEPEPRPVGETPAGRPALRLVR
jgi:integrase